MNKISTAMSACVLATTALTGSAMGVPVRIAPPEGEQTVVYEEPEGEKKLYSRTCRAFRELLGSVEQIIEEGSIVSYVEQEDGSVWLHNMVSMYAAPGWVKAQKDGDKLIINGPQPVYEEYDWDLDDGTMITYYLSPVKIVEYENEEGEMMKTYAPTEDGVFTFDILESGTLKESGDGDIILGIVAYNEENGYFWTGYGDNYIVMSQPSGEYVQLPESAEIHTSWAMHYYDSQNMENAKFVDVAIDGSDYYIRGIYPGLPDTWIKGTLTGKEVFFPNFQYLGPDFDWNYFIYTAGGQMDDLDDDGYYTDAILDSDGFVMTLEEDGSLTAENHLIFVTSPQTDQENANYVDYFEGIVINPQDPSTFTNPANPFDISLGGVDGVAIEGAIPNTDRNGNLLNVDNLYIMAYVNSEVFTFSPESYDDIYELGIYESTTELPYQFSPYCYNFYQEGTWHTIYINGIEQNEIFNVGLQSAYYPEGKDVNPDNVLMSDIIMVGDNPNSVDSVFGSKEIKEVRFFDMQGRRIARPASGMFIKTTVFSDGSEKTVKVSRK